MNSCFHISSLYSFIFSPRKRTHPKDPAQIHSGSTVFASCFCISFRTIINQQLVDGGPQTRNHAFENAASFSSSSCSLLLMAQEAFTPPFKSSAFEVIKQGAVYRQEILKCLIAFFPPWHKADSLKRSLTHEEKDTCPCLNGHETGDCEIEHICDQTTFKPTSSPLFFFFLLVLTISFQLLFIFFFLLLV